MEQLLNQYNTEIDYKIMGSITQQLFTLFVTSSTSGSSTQT